MKIKLTRAGYQRYTAHVTKFGVVSVERSGNPTAVPCHRWAAFGCGLYVHGHTLREIRLKLSDAMSEKASSVEEC